MKKQRYPYRNNDFNPYKTEGKSLAFKIFAWVVVAGIVGQIVVYWIQRI